MGEEKTLYLVRHCQDLPTDDLDQERAAKASLTSVGRRQARALARYLRARGVESIYSSVFERSKETGRIIYTHTGGVFSFDERLNEQVLARTLLKGHEAKSIKRRMLEDPHFVPDGGQSLAQSIEQFLFFLDEICHSPHRHICVVSHGFLMQAALRRRFQLSETPQLQEGSVTIIVYRHGQMRLSEVNVRPYFMPRAEEKMRSVLDSIRKKFRGSSQTAS